MADYTGRSKAISYLFQNGGGGGGSCKVISGYYHDGDFYEDQSYTQIITGDTECLYIDLDTITLYLFDGTDYVEVQGGGGGTGGGSYACDLLFENTNLTPTSGTSDVDKSFTLNASIDDYDSVLVMIYGYTYLSSSSGIISMMIPKSEYYKRAIGSSGDAQIREAFVVNNSTDTQRRSLCFGFADSTTIYTEGIRTTSGVEPMLYKVYGMNFGGSLHTYSTTEQIVGTWIDGKPIYEKTFTNLNLTVTNANTWYRSGCFISDIGQVITGFSIDSSGQMFPTALGIYLSDEEIAYCITTLAGNSRVIDTLVVQYTKSTD